MNSTELIANVENLRIETIRKFDLAISLINKDFEFKTLNLDEINSLEKLKNVIYFIKVESKFDNQKFLIDFDTLKKRKPKIKFPQINKNTNTNILYVGKSSTDFKSRIKCHLGNNSLTTYALHYKVWNDLDNFKNIQLKIFYYQFKDSVENDVLELIETSLHKKVNPLLGRSGH